ncbi:MAG: BON domain-containing protein [Alphaproteobacteria bacterium]|mgnify:CR=1 FL=1|jgi:osmotically-inducible protein OsmY|nr:BON domain-containing protein [Alphaproteobacteria bacterium]MBT7943384.1 BON domain-containing protein [Alphaproteobacteria bacterium]
MMIRGNLNTAPEKPTLMRSSQKIVFRPAQIVAMLVSLSIAIVSGCASVVVGGGAAVGTAAYQERGVQGVARDIATATRMRTNLLNAGEDFVTGVGVEVYEGRLLLTGMLPTEDMQAQTVGMAWKTEGVKDVLNEIQTGSTNLRDFAKDSWITTQLHSRITLDEKILAINYSVETVNGLIYLIGIAQNQTELNRVIAHAKSIGYVKRIINHVRIKKGAS